MLTKIEEYNKNNIVHLPSLIQNPEEVDTEIVSDFVKSIHQKIELKVKKKTAQKNWAANDFNYQKSRAGNIRIRSAGTSASLRISKQEKT